MGVISEIIIVSDWNNYPQKVIHCLLRAEKKIYKLTFRFKHIILLYDTDKTGKESARKQEKQLEEFSVKRLLLPLSGTKEEKDISDYFKAGNTREDFLKLFIEFLDNLYSDTLIML